MSATKELRRLLNERGIEWMCGAFAPSEDTFYMINGYGYLATDMKSGKLRISVEGYLSPGQALDATAGPRIDENTSDGYHTFGELYHHRAVLFSVIVRLLPHIAWKSKLHHDGTMYDGMFIVGIETPQGQATYHYDLDPYWDMFDCKELDCAPEWDGHTPDDAISRIATLGPGQIARHCDVREQIVRCEDCIWFSENATAHDEDYPHFCYKLGIDLKDGKGFCAWSLRAEDA